MLTEELCFDFVIRFRGNIARHRHDGRNPHRCRLGCDPADACVLRGTAMHRRSLYPVGTVVCVQDPDMKQAWCLAASSTTATAKHLIGYYARRWGIECGLRDTKDLRFGMGLGAIHVKSPERRDRLWLINAFAVVLLTLLGAAGEGAGLRPDAQDQHRQAPRPLVVSSGLYALRSGPDDAGNRAASAEVQRFSQMLQDQPLFADVFGPV